MGSILGPCPMMWPLGTAQGLGSLRPTPPLSPSAWWYAGSINPSNGSSVASLPDSSGSGYTMSQSVHKPLWESAQIGGQPALLFDGVRDILNSSLISGAGSSPWSLYVLLQATAGATGAIAASVGQDSSPSGGYGIGIRGSEWGVLNCGVGWYQASGNAPDTAWHLLTATYNGTTLTIYLDGVSIGSQSATFSSPATGCHIGSDGDASGEDFWPGYVAEVIADVGVCHTSSQVATRLAYITGVYGPYVGCVLHYNLSEGSGTTLHDLSGNGNNGTLNGGVAWQGSAGSYDLSCNGSSNIIKSNSATGFPNNGSAFSFAVWANANSASGSPVLAMAADNIVSGYASAIYVILRDGNCKVENWGGLSLVNAGVASLNTWIHYAVCCTSSAVSFYINGSLVGSNNRNTNGNNLVEYSLGCIYNGSDQGGEPLSGLLGSSSLFDRTLTAADVSALYALGRNG